MGNVKTVVLLLGGNLGDRLSQLAAARGHLAGLGRIRAQSQVYETAAWGNEQQPPFLNQVVLLDTRVAPLPLLDELLAIERSMGRQRDQKWEARPIDLDILFIAADVIQNERLTVPHPHIASRRFALVPLAEVMPDFVHPVLAQTMRQLLAACADPLPVEPYATR